MSRSLCRIDRFLEKEMETGAGERKFLSCRKLLPVQTVYSYIPSADL